MLQILKYNFDRYNLTTIIVQNWRIRVTLSYERVILYYRDDVIGRHFERRRLCIPIASTRTSRILRDEKCRVVISAGTMGTRYRIASPKNCSPDNCRRTLKSLLHSPSYTAVAVERRLRATCDASGHPDGGIESAINRRARIEGEKDCRGIVNLLWPSAVVRARSSPRAGGRGELDRERLAGPDGRAHAARKYCIITSDVLLC